MAPLHATALWEAQEEIPTFLGQSRICCWNWHTFNPLISRPQVFLFLALKGVFAPHVYLVPFGLDNLGNWQPVLILLSKILLWIPSSPVLSGAFGRPRDSLDAHTACEYSEMGRKKVRPQKLCGKLMWKSDTTNVSSDFKCVTLTNIFVESNVHKNSDRWKRMPTWDCSCS